MNPLAPQFVVAIRCNAHTTTVKPAPSSLTPQNWLCARRAPPVVWWRTYRVVVRVIWAISSLCLVVVASGCSSKSDVMAGESENGRHVQLSVGDIFDIVLPSDYEKSKCQWHDDQTNDWAILRPLGTRYEPQKALPGRPETGTYTRRFEAISPGTVPVTLVQEDNGNPPRDAGRYVVDVTVR